MGNFPFDHVNYDYNCHFALTLQVQNNLGIDIWNAIPELNQEQQVITNKDIKDTWRIDIDIVDDYSAESNM